MAQDELKIAIGRVSNCRTPPTNHPSRDCLGRTESGICSFALHHIDVAKLLPSAAAEASITCRSKLASLTASWPVSSGIEILSSVTLNRPVHDSSPEKGHVLDVWPTTEQRVIALLNSD